MTHLMTRYRRITPIDLEACNKRMSDPIDQAQPINGYFKRIDDAVQYAADGDNAYTTNQVVQKGYHASISTGEYTDACK